MRSVGVVANGDFRLGQTLLKPADRLGIDGRALQRELAQGGEVSQLADARG